MKVYKIIRKYKKIINSQFLVILIGTFLTSLTYSMMFPYFAIYLKTKLTLSATAAAIIIMIFTGLRRQVVIIGGILIDRFGHKKLFCVGLLIHAIFYFSMSVEMNYTIIFIMAILSTVGGALTIPTVRTLTVSNIDDKYKVEAFGLRALVFNFAATIGPLIGSYIANYSFSILFICCGISYSMYLLMVIIVFHEVDNLNKSTKVLMKSIKEIKYNYASIVILLMSFMFFFLSSQESSTIPMYLKSVGKISNVKIGSLFTIAAIFSVTFQQLVASFTSKMKYSQSFLITLISLTVGFSIYIFTKNYYIIILSSLIMTFAELICIPVLYSSMLEVAPANLKGTYSGFASFFEGLGTSCGVYIGGVFLDNIKSRNIWIVFTIIGALSVVFFKLFGENNININVVSKVNKKINMR